MKAISIKEPWATMIYERKKTIETRTWKTNHRGDLLLCASKKPESKLSGNAFAVANLVDCRPMVVKDEELACCVCYHSAYSWVLENIQKVELFPIKGQLGLFEVDIISLMIQIGSEGK